MTTRHRSPFLAGVLLLAVTALAGCSDDDSSDRAEADVAACRTVLLVDASLDGTRRTAVDGIFNVALVSDYDTAIATASAAVSDPDVSDDVAAATVELVGAWSRNRSRISQLIGLDSYNPDALQTLIDAEERLLQSVQSVCPGGGEDENDDD